MTYSESIQNFALNNQFTVFFCISPITTRHKLIGDEVNTQKNTLRIMTKRVLAARLYTIHKYTNLDIPVFKMVMM